MNQYQHFSNSSACMLSCDGRSHDISNLISPHCDYSYFDCTTAQSQTSPPARRVSVCSDASSGSLYPKIDEDDQEKEKESHYWKEWMSDSDYVESERRQLPLHLQKNSATRVSFRAEDMVVDYNPEEEEEEDDDEEHPMLEISPGVRVPYIGTAARTRALIKFSTREQRTTVQTVCLGCRARLVCMGNVKYLACVACHSVSPLDLPRASGDPKPRGAGIGLLVEEAELLRRRTHSC